MVNGFSGSTHSSSKERGDTMAFSGSDIKVPSGKINSPDSISQVRDAPAVSDQLTESAVAAGKDPDARKWV